MSLQTEKRERDWVAPLIEYPELVETVRAGPLSTINHTAESEICQQITGRVLVVAECEQQANDYRDVCAELDSVTETVVQTVSVAESKTADLPDGVFDTLIYQRDQGPWMARSSDIQRLTPLLAGGATVLAKSKWLPRSKYLELERIFIAGAYGFESPSVYVQFTKNTSVLTSFAEGSRRDQPDTPNQEPTCVRDSRAVDLPPQFRYGDEKAEFEPGWSWHSYLTDWVADQIADADRSLNICPGANELGDIRADLLDPTAPEHADADLAANIQADARELAVKTNAVDATVADPPWKVPPAERARFFSEAVRVTKPGGIVIHNAWWLPRHPYATPIDVRACTANVIDQSIKGCGGLSFVVIYRVEELPDLGPLAQPYRLADHISRAGSVEQAVADMEKTPTQRDPRSDPRFCSPSDTATCKCCGASYLTPIELPQRVVFECAGCAYRNDPDELTGNG